MSNPAVKVTDLSTKALRDFISIRNFTSFGNFADRTRRGLSRQALLDSLFIESVEDDLLMDLVREMPKEPCNCGPCVLIRLLTSKGTPVLILGEPPDPAGGC